MNLSRTSITWLAVSMMIAAAGIGVWMWQRVQNDDEVATLKNQISVFEQNNTNNGQSSPTNINEDDNNSQVSSSGNETNNSVNSSNLPVVIFDPSGLFNDALKQSIKQNITEPMTLYQQYQNQPVVAFHVQTSQVEGEYSVTAIMQNEAYSQFMIGGDKGIKWIPVCMDRCTFSEEFSTKYPDIVSETNP